MLDLAYSKLHILQKSHDVHPDLKIDKMERLYYYRRGIDYQCTFIQLSDILSSHYRKCKLNHGEALDLVYSKLYWMRKSHNF